MLNALSIRSFVLIDRLDLEASKGFTALTGETGAGKSIILDALGLVLGGPADRKQVRSGCDQASLSAEFYVEASHPAWAVCAQHGLEYDPQEALILRRIVQASGPSRAFVNGQPVAAAVLSDLGDVLVEIHGQHSASKLLRPSVHLDLLDAYAGLEPMAQKCSEQWRMFEICREDRRALEAAVQAARERMDWLSFAVTELSALGLDSGEVEALSSQRAALLQSERVNEAIEEASSALRDSKLDEALTKAAKAADRVVRVPGLEALGSGLEGIAGAASDAIERALIELAEAQSAVRDLAHYAGHDPNLLESVEARLFSLRAAARKYDCQPEHLLEQFERLQKDLDLCVSDNDALEAAKDQEQSAHTQWRATADKLSNRRKTTAPKLETAIMAELNPLHLGRVRLRVQFSDIGEEDSGAKGLERAQFEVETNPGAGFGALKVIASGGELARFSLALKCALSQSGGIGTLIFDEADQGVGGAVAAAIGERLSGLSDGRQVFAVTHSPQVASAASRQWRVLKEVTKKGAVTSKVAQLDEGQRLEEIARMLSGSSITNEARAAALKLLEAA